MRVFKAVLFPWVMKTIGHVAMPLREMHELSPRRIRAPEKHLGTLGDPENSVPFDIRTDMA
jgi:hypothetical protein